MRDFEHATGDLFEAADLGTDAPSSPRTARDWVRLPQAPESGRSLQVRHPDQFHNQPCGAVYRDGLWLATEWRGAVAVAEWRYLGPRP